MKYPKLAGLQFSEATAEQFKEFFEANGWECFIQSGMIQAIRHLKTNKNLRIWRFGELVIDDLCSDATLNTYCTFGNALQTANKIADALGGWTE